MKEYRFILEKYKGRATRYTCPNCGKPRCFTRYIDKEGKINFPPGVGRCDHEHRCGYHYTPAQYFQDHPEAKEQLGDELPHTYNSRPTPALPTHPLKEPYYFDMELVKKTEAAYSHNNFYKFLATAIGEEKAKEVSALYHLGTSKLYDGATVFWQIDIEGRPRTAKIMLYDAKTGHRTKDELHHINWLQSLMHIDRDRIHQCFFGEHLLAEETNKDKVVAFVESEKSAMIASTFLPQYVWIATGGKDGMFSQANLSILMDRKVMLFPDLGMMDNWHKKTVTLQSRGIDADIFTYLEENATAEEREQGLDIADYLLRSDTKENILRAMIERNPAIGILVGRLHLEIVEDE